MFRVFIDGQAGTTGLQNRQAVLMARLDNPGKGASGAVVQNLQLMLGLQEPDPAPVGQALHAGSC